MSRSETLAFSEFNFLAVAGKIDVVDMTLQPPIVGLSNSSYSPSMVSALSPQGLSQIFDNILGWTILTKYSNVAGS